MVIDPTVDYCLHTIIDIIFLSVSHMNNLQNLKELPVAILSKCYINNCILFLYYTVSFFYKFEIHFKNLYIEIYLLFCYHISDPHLTGMN